MSCTVFLTYNLSGNYITDLPEDLKKITFAQSFFCYTAVESKISMCVGISMLVSNLVA